MIKAVYPGTFDPFTRGHEDIVRRASKLFDEVVIAVASGVHKQPLFDLDERMLMASDSVQDLDNASVHGFYGLLSQFVDSCGASVVIRGLRAASDFEYEFQLAGMNRQIMPKIESLFLVPSSQHQFVSGTFVREIAQLGGDVSAFVPTCVFERMNKIQLSKI